MIVDPTMHRHWYDFALFVILIAGFLFEAIVIERETRLATSAVAKKIALTVAFYYAVTFAIPPPDTPITTGAVVVRAALIAAVFWETGEIVLARYRRHMRRGGDPVVFWVSHFAGFVALIFAVIGAIWIGQPVLFWVLNH